MTPHPSSFFGDVHCSVQGRRIALDGHVDHSWDHWAMQLGDNQTYHHSRSFRKWVRSNLDSVIAWNHRSFYSSTFPARFLHRTIVLSVSRDDSELSDNVSGNYQFMVDGYVGYHKTAQLWLAKSDCSISWHSRVMYENFRNSTYVACDCFFDPLWSKLGGF